MGDAADNAGGAENKLARPEMVRHCVARVGEKIAPLMGDVVRSAVVSPETKTLWIVDNACAQQMTGPCIAGDDIEGVAEAQQLTRSEKTLAPVPSAAPFTNLVYMARQKLFLGFTPGECKLGVFDLTMDLMSTADAPAPVHSAKMNPVTLELTTGGVGEITLWLWRARRMILDVRHQLVGKHQMKAKFASQSHFRVIKTAPKSGFEMCFAPNTDRCRGSQPKHVSNPESVCKYKIFSNLLTTTFSSVQFSSVQFSSVPPF